MFFGTFTHTLDNKGRMVIPSRFRADLGTQVYILRGYEGAVEVYRREAFDQMVAHLETLVYTNKDARAFIRSRLASTVEIDIDDHGRMALPTKLLAEYKIGPQVTIIGVNDHFEIWDGQAWAAYIDGANARLEEVADKLHG